MLLKRLKRGIAKLVRCLRKQYLKAMGVSIGKGGMISFGAHIDHARGKVSIGNKVVITSGCYILSHSIVEWRLNPEKKILFHETIIEDNVFIGVNSVILPGVKVGKNSVIGAGSVVTKDLPPNVVVAGNPAKVIKSL